MEKISIIKNYSDNKLKKYFETENLDVLHKMKLYLDNLYYNEGKDTGLSDYQYDLLKDIIKYRDPNYVVPVGAKIREHDNRSKLPFWLGSMDKLKPEDKIEIANWITKNNAKEYIVEDKLDGISCLITIKNGNIKLYTRGDGIVGADISYLAPYFDSIPKNIGNISLNIRGELIMPIDIFNKKYSKEYSNPRNMVAGRIGGKKIRDGIRDIKFIAYEIVDDGMLDKPADQISKLKRLGFETVNYSLIKKIDILTLMEILVSRKNNNIFEIDGLIIQANKNYERNVDGNPKYAFAFKMRLSDNIKETKVIEVLWNISKWGQLKPRIEIEPVNLGGVKISYTTGFNGKYVYENNIGEGAIIKITRSGDVIPYIVEVVKQADNPDMPDIPWKWNDTKVDIITEDFGEMMCIKLIHSFFEKLGIKHLGEKTIQKMYENGLDTIIKIISADKERIESVDGIASKGAERIYEGIQKGLVNLQVPNVLGASGIFGFGMGTKKINRLFEEYPNILTEYKFISREILTEKILKIEGFSDKTTKNIVKNIEWADKFIYVFSNFANFAEKNIINDSMKNIKVVFSGFRDKKLAEDVVARGGKVVSSISKNTTLLIVSNKNEQNTDKVKKAKELNIGILSKEEFLKKYIDNK
jgi:NAD-dependent DNA ligase